MSDIAEYTIILFENDISELKEILEMFLNLILFHRNLSNNDYEDAQGKLTNITYVKLKNETLNQEIMNIINEIEKLFSKEPKLYGYNLSLSFFEKSEKKENPWEKWNFISIFDKKEELSKKNEIKNDKSDSDSDKENKIREYMFKKFLIALCLMLPLCATANYNDVYVANIEYDWINKSALEKGESVEGYISDFQNDFNQLTGLANLYNQ